MAKHLSIEGILQTTLEVPGQGPGLQLNARIAWCTEWKDNTNLGRTLTLITTKLISLRPLTESSGVSACAAVALIQQ